MLLRELIIIGALTPVFCTLNAQGLRLEAAGARVGFSSVSADHNFHQVDIAANWNLPWNWALGSHMQLQSRIDLSAGWLGDPGGDAAIGTFGPSLVLSRKGFPLALEGGVSPTLLSQHEFQSKDLGSYFQFTSHAGLNWDFSHHFRLAYRFQHMSNAGLATPNPGLNLHMLGVSYFF